MGNRFQEDLLNKNVFAVSLEIVAGRGSYERAQEKAVEIAGWAGKDKRIAAVSITDSPGGRPGIDPAMMALEIKKSGVEPIVHYTLKDKNRLHIESELYGYERAGIENLIIMTGDFPKKGYFSGNGKPVFDIDPVHTLELIRSMNQGLHIREGKTLQPSNFFAGCVITPFKNVEAEIITEYIKLQKKLNAGAAFIMSQVGYDMRKFHELRQLTRELAPEVPLIGNIFVIDKKLAQMIHLHRFTGCTIPEKLYHQIMAEDESRAEKEHSLIRGAKMFAIMKGLGYDGAHIGGESLTAEDIDFILTKGTELSLDWQALLPEFEGFDDGAFYYYHRDPKNGLNTAKKNDLSLLPVEEKRTLNYRMLCFLHSHIYEKHGILSKAASAFGRRSAKGGFSRGVERGLRSALLQCRDCGDCAIAFTDMICPMTHCPKQQRNGPCGGSRNGYCELYPNKRHCIYVTAYNRLKLKGRTDLLRTVVAPPNCSLYGTSELNNFFTKKDTYGKLKG